MVVRIIVLEHEIQPLRNRKICGPFCSSVWPI